jgi:hypothetical protein
LHNLSITEPLPAYLSTNAAPWCQWNGGVGEVFRWVVCGQVPQEAHLATDGQRRKQNDGGTSISHIKDRGHGRVVPVCILPMFGLHLSCVCLHFGLHLAGIWPTLGLISARLGNVFDQHDFNNADRQLFSGFRISVLECLWIFRNHLFCFQFLFCPFIFRSTWYCLWWGSRTFGEFGQACVGGRCATRKVFSWRRL